MTISKRHKYGAQRTTVDNITFASKAEAKRYGELKMLEKASQIHGLILQPRYELSVDNGDYPDNDEGRSIPLGDYIADFEYCQCMSRGAFCQRTQRKVEDVKGFKTALYRWKKKHFEAQYGISITEVA